MLHVIISCIAGGNTPCKMCLVAYREIMGLVFRWGLDAMLIGRPGSEPDLPEPPGPGAEGGGVWGQHAAAGKKSPWIASLQSSYHLIHSLARPPPCAAAPCSPSTACSYDMVANGVQMMAQ